MLDLTKLNDGDIVVVTEDVTNPKPDRRTKHNWTLAETVPKGTKLRVRVKTIDYFALGDDFVAKMRKKLDDDTINGDTPWVYELVPLSTPYGDGLAYTRDGKVDHARERKTDALATKILEVVEPMTDLTLGDLLRQKNMVGRSVGNQCDRLLAVLLEHGKIDIADVKMAISVYDGINDGEWESFKAKHGL